eukprot:345362-Amphidinium_carterae.2
MEPEHRAGQPMASGICPRRPREPVLETGVVEHVDADVHIMGLSMQDMHTSAQVIDEGRACGTTE